MTKDEITKALTTTADTGEPSGLDLDWEKDDKLIVTMPDGLFSFTLLRANDDGIYFVIKINEYCSIFGDGITVTGMASIGTITVTEGESVVGKIYME